MWNYLPEAFTDVELEVLSRYFTNSDKPVFALVNLPEVVKGALFARYSRSSKSLRRLFLDEFYEGGVVSNGIGGQGSAGVKRAEALYERMLADYGDDSVAQLGGVHLACEQASNILTKVLERGRLMAYLEQSTRYVPYDKVLPDGNFRYFVPREIAEAGLEKKYRRHMDSLFAGYKEIFDAVETRLLEITPRESLDSDFVFRSSIRAVALDTARGILPASAVSNVGIFASAQAYEALILRMRASNIAEAREYAELIKTELDKVIPAFLTRVDRPDRGGVWVDYLALRSRALSGLSFSVSKTPDTDSHDFDDVNVKLVRFDPDGEKRIAAAVIFGQSQLSMPAAMDVADSLTDSDLATLIRQYFGERQNRRHKPGRAFEQTNYLFEVECDYGAFRDLQRHRMLTIEWQVLDTSLGYMLPELVSDFGLKERYLEIMDGARVFHSELRDTLEPEICAYAVPMAYKIRFTMDLNAREALHLIELRSSPQGHSSYRKVAQRMFSCIRDVAGHRNVAASMKFVDFDDYRIGRLSSLRQVESKNKGIFT
ncbi:MAG: thymidylate synthase [Acidimicrobiaceae bacterium]|nr:thymidylate synthase [Acidimicrobiaceae bacterium]